MLPQFESYKQGSQAIKHKLCLKNLLKNEFKIIYILS